MKAHTEQEFETFMTQLLETNADLGFYTDFQKCHENVSKIAIKLHSLNYLIGKENMEAAIHDLWIENPTVFSVLDILIAVRAKDRKMVINNNDTPQLIETYFKSEEGVVEYIDKTGLKEILCNKQITNLVDYVFGIEVGLDTNARKNRSGHIMERMVANILTKAGIDFEQEVYSHEFPSVYDALGVDSKRFDFVIKTSSKTYLLEVNFYSGGGSKLNEVARAYTELAPKVNSCDGYEFVWITDGIGWNSAKGKLEEAFYTIPHIYNLTTIDDFVKQIKENPMN